MDDFENYQTGLTTPAQAAEAVTPDDTTPLTHATRALYVGTGGDVVVGLVSGDVVTLKGVLGGALYPLRVAQVFAIGTTASDLVGLR